MLGQHRTPRHYEFISDFFTHNIPLWQEHLHKYGGRPDLTFLEIGSLEGRSAVWLLENILTGRSCILHCVDPWDDPTIEATFDHNALVASERSAARLVKHKGRSIDVLPTFPPETLDLIYVDGSHVSKDVLSDLVLAWRLLRVGGTLICDDYALVLEVSRDRVDGARPGDAGPRIAINAFLSCFERHYRLLHKDWQVLLDKTR